MNHINARVRKILDEITYPTIATTDEMGLPWAAPQFTVYMPDTKTFYWCASNTSQHARNIEANFNVYIVAYDSTAAPGKGEGVYIRAYAAKVENKQEQREAYIALRERHGEVPYWHIEDIQSPQSPNSIFKATAHEAWINKGSDIHGHFVLYRETVELS